MRILIDIGHPGHVHLFRPFVLEMQKRSHIFLFTCRQKEFEIELLQSAGFSYKSFGSHYKSKLGLSLALFLSKSLREAELSFTELLEKDIPQNVKKTVKRYIKKINNLKKQHFLSVFASLSTGYDTNINNGNDYEILGVKTNPKKSKLLTLFCLLISS